MSLSLRQAEDLKERLPQIRTAHATGRAVQRRLSVQTIAICVLLFCISSAKRGGYCLMRYLIARPTRLQPFCLRATHRQAPLFVSCHDFDVALVLLTIS
jgi:hypothetical protein